jgi:ketosteroid isomerase-like protein
MDPAPRDRLIERFLGAWNDQEVARVLDCYTDDLRYRDPNTRGEVVGRAAMGRYLAKLFAAWRMTWARREVFDLADGRGVAFLWRATFRRAGGQAAIEVDGMDLAVMRGDRLERNEVYFDRAALQPLFAGGQRPPSG